MAIILVTLKFLCWCSDANLMMNFNKSLVCVTVIFTHRPGSMLHLELWVHLPSFSSGRRVLLSRRLYSRKWQPLLCRWVPKLILKPDRSRLHPGCLFQLLTWVSIRELKLLTFSSLVYIFTLLLFALLPRLQWLSDLGDLWPAVWGSSWDAPLQLCWWILHGAGSYL